jgi:hypothetical protein
MPETAKHKALAEPRERRAEKDGESRHKRDSYADSSPHKDGHGRPKSAPASSAPPRDPFHDSPSRKEADRHHPHRGGHHEREKIVIGWSERIDFPDWGIKGLRAKVDTGARTSALHVEDLEILPDGRARFDVILDKRPPKSRSWKRVSVCAVIVKRAPVRSSTGKFTKRYFVRTKVQLGPLVKEIELSLVSRQNMVFRMLLGRKAVERDFLVDVSRRDALEATLSATPKRL